MGQISFNKNISIVMIFIICILTISTVNASDNIDDIVGMEESGDGLISINESNAIGIANDDILMLMMEIQ